MKNKTLLIAGLVIFATAVKSTAQIYVNIDIVDASTAPVNAIPCLDSYGITFSVLNGDGGLSILNDNASYDSPQYLYASPGDNFIAEGSANGSTSSSVLLTFAKPLSSLSFSTVELTGGPGYPYYGNGNSWGAWSVEVFSGANEVGSASRGTEVCYPGNSVPAQTYSFSGANITSMEIDGNNEGWAGTGGILMDDLNITPVPEPTTLALAGLSGLSLFLFRRQRK